MASSENNLENPKSVNSGPLKEHPSTTVLLIDDQPIFAEVIKRIFELEDDVSFHYCEDPAKALEVALEVKPTIILQDLVMPGANGLDMVKLFRGNEQTKNVPMIILSSRVESDIKSQAFSLGANDYMVKLPDRLEFVARIRHHSQGYINLIERNAAFDALISELNEAARYVKSLLPEKIDSSEIKTDWVFISSTELGGDAFGYHWIDDDHFAMYLLDVCGHGVGAALLSASAINVLRHQSLTNTDFKSPCSVLEGLNQAFDMNKHNQMYFTLWYGVYKKSTRELSFASGGHPPAVLIHETNSQQLKTENTIIGTSFKVPFKDQKITVPSNSKLYLFSDGIYEMTPAEGKEALDLQKIETLFAKNNKSPLEEIVNQIKASVGRDNFDDDFSLLEILFQ